MSGWRRIRAGFIVAAVFGFIWAACLSLVQVIVIVGYDGPGTLQGVGWMLTSIFLMLFVLGSIQGLMLAGGMAAAGRDESVDSFPRLKAAVLGAVFGAIGPAAMWLWRMLFHPNEFPMVAPWGMLAVSAALGAFATASLLSVARRGALPPAPAEPKKIRP